MSHDREPVIRELAGSRHVDLLALHERWPGRYPHLLESAAAGTPQGRYDILFACPGESLHLGRDGLQGPHAAAGGFLAALDAWQSGLALPPEPPGPQRLPFRGGWFLYLGYELAGEVEPRLRLPHDTRLPTAFAVRCPAAVVRDHRSGRLRAVAEAGQEALLEGIAADVAEQAGAEEPPVPASVLAGALQEEDPGRYRRMVRKTRDYIIDGDIFQANLSRQWQGRLQAGVTPAMLYRRLRRANPAPFAGLARWGDAAIVSSSPERLAEVRDGEIQTRPIAGTRPRRPGEDEAMLRELIGHPKERAEHVMLIDLERNDIGRVCRPGSVHVSELMVLESYAHVHHIVSNVKGRLRDGITPGQALRAVFPGGTITGCPKVRCMEIIAELEQAPRGAYTGSMGYLNRDGTLDTNILIRTLVVNGQELTLRAGGGIVADSRSGPELEETRAKARGLVLALQ